MSNESKSNPSNHENKEKMTNNEDTHDIFYMDSVERIKLIGTISDCDTQTLLNAYIDILGIESLRPFLLETFFKSIPIASPINRNKKKKSIIPPPLPTKTQKLLNKTLSKNGHHHNHKKKTQKNKSHLKNGRNFASASHNQSSKQNSRNKNSKLIIHSTNQPLPSRTTPAHNHLQTNALIRVSQSNGASIHSTHQLSSHNNIVTGHSSEKEEEKQDIESMDNMNMSKRENNNKKKVIIPAPIAKHSIEFNISLPVRIELLDKKCINKYFNFRDKYPQDLKVFGDYGELPDDIYMKIFTFLDFHTVMNSLRLVSRSWFNISSQSSSIGHFKCILPIMHHAFQMDTFQFINKFEISWKCADALKDRWSVYNKLLTECCKVNMRDIQWLCIKFHDFSFYSFNKHPLKRLFIKQRCLMKLELNAILHWKEHDIADALSLIIKCPNVLRTLQSFIIHNFVINPSRDELIELKQQMSSQNGMAMNMNMHCDIMLRSAVILGEFLCKCKRLQTFKWYYRHVNRQYTCYGIYIAFYVIYFQSNKVQQWTINDLQLPAFPISHKNKEILLYNEIVHKLKLNKLYFKGDLSIINWKMLGLNCKNLQYLDLYTTRVTNESFTDCFSCIKSLQYISINTTSLATQGWYQNDELNNFITPYFRCKHLNKLRHININVKFLEEKSLFAFLLKCKYGQSLQIICINGQSFNGQLKNEDIRKYIGQFIGKKELIFKLCIKSQFYSSLRVLKVIKKHGVKIDKEKWKKKKKCKIKDDHTEDIQQSLSMKLADIHNSGHPRFQ